MRLHVALLSLVLAAGPAACAFILDFDEVQGGDADASTSLPFSELPAQYAGALCKRVDRCFGALAKAALGDEVCVEYFGKVLGQSVFSSLGDLDPDRFVYHPARGPACISAIENADCDVLFPSVAECDSALEGFVADGGECAHPVECAAGLYCDVSAGTCPGTCLPRLTAGELCETGVCAKGLQCEAVTEGANVVEKCLAPVSASASCGDEHPSCRVDMFCLGELGNPKQCYPIGGLFTVGEDLGCNWREGPLCGPGLHCALTGLANLDGKCVAPAAANAECSFALPDMCPSGQYCDAIPGFPGSCVPLPVAGEACTQYALKALCKKGHRCLDRGETPAVEPGTCFGIVGLTDACNQDAVCYSGRCDDNSCVPPNFCAAPN